MSTDPSILEYYDVRGFSAEESCRSLVRLLAYVTQAEKVSIAFTNGTNVSLSRNKKNFSTDVGIDLTTLVDAVSLSKFEVDEIVQTDESASVFPAERGLVRVWAVPVFSSSEQIVGMLIAGHDQRADISLSQKQALIALSQLVQYELEIRRHLLQQEKYTIQANKLSTLGEMAAGIAHEINNPLAIIQGNLNKIRTLIEKERLDVAQMLDSVTTAARTVGRIVKIVSGLRSFARDEVGEPFQSAELQQLVEETLSFCHERFKNLNIQMTVQFERASVLLECRPVQISQVLLNLLMNSFDAVTEKESAGKTSPGKSSAEKWIRIDCGEDSDFITIRITDSGLGVSQSIQRKVFQPFFTTKPLGKGTGLGLSIARGIVESHRGELMLDVDSVHTSFVIRLPKSQSNSQVKSMTRAHPKSKAKSRSGSEGDS
jgi:signal transduction histidine kinase